MLIGVCPQAQDAFVLLPGRDRQAGLHPEEEGPGGQGEQICVSDGGCEKKLQIVHVASPVSVAVLSPPFPLFSLPPLLLLERLWLTCTTVTAYGLGAPCPLFARRQVLAAARDPQEALQSPSHTAGRA